MSDTKFTPGPWVQFPKVVKGISESHYRVIQSGHGFYCMKTKSGFALTGYINPCNAALIAAAPDMYEALQFCKSVLEKNEFFDVSDRMAIDKAKEALAKAEGKGDPTT